MINGKHYVWQGELMEMQNVQMENVQLIHH